MLRTPRNPRDRRVPRRLLFSEGALTWHPKPSQESAEARRPGYLGKAEARSQRAGTADTAHEQTVSGNREEG